MPIFRRKYAKKRAPLRAKKTKKSFVSSSVRKYVKRTISKTIENKCIQVNGGFSFGNYLESPDLGAYPMAPLALYWSLPQSIGQGGRIGNQVKIKSAHLNYILRPTPYDAVSNPNPCPTEVQLMLGYLRASPNTLPVAADINQLFQAGSSSAGPVGTLRDLISSINTDKWVIKKRWTHKLGFADNSGTGALPGSQYFDNNDFHLNIKRSINITKMLPSHFRFNDTEQSNLTKNLFFLQNAVQANGSGGGATQLFANIEFWIDIRYEDA